MADPGGETLWGGEELKTDCLTEEDEVRSLRGVKVPSSYIELGFPSYIEFPSPLHFVLSEARQLWRRVANTERVPSDR